MDEIKDPEVLKSLADLELLNRLIAQRADAWRAYFSARGKRRAALSAEIRRLGDEITEMNYRGIGAIVWKPETK